jgi:hypothetical protein
MNPGMGGYARPGTELRSNAPQPATDSEVLPARALSSQAANWHPIALTAAGAVVNQPRCRDSTRNAKVNYI